MTEYADKYVIAFDVGTSGIKAVLSDADGKVLAEATRDYPVLVASANWAEQSAQTYWDEACCVSNRVLQLSGVDPSQVAGLAFCTMWKGIIPVDANGQLLRNNILWLDMRAGEQAQRLNEYFGRELFSDSDYWPKLLWFRENEPDLYECTETIFEVNAYLKWKATGVAAMDMTNSFVCSYDSELEKLYTEFLDYSNIDPKKFPPVCDPTSRVGLLTIGAAEALGLVAGTPVFGGCNDITAIAVGAGCISENTAHAYLGSSGWISMTEEHKAGCYRYAPLCEGWDISCHGLQAVGLCIRWMLDALYRDTPVSDGQSVYNVMNKEVESVPPGSEGVLATPWFYGEVPPQFSAKARGCYLNLGRSHGRAHMARATMEGVAYALKMRIMKHLQDADRPMPEQLRVVGGGASSDVWMQILADVLNVPVFVMQSSRHTGALGAAACVLVGLGVYRDLADQAKSVQIDKGFLPQASVQPVYRNGYDVFCGLHDLIKPLFDCMNS